MNSIIDFDDIEDGLGDDYICADVDRDGYGGEPLTHFKMYMDEIKGQMYLIVAGRLNPKNGTWTLRCRKGRNVNGTQFVKNVVPELTSQAVEDVINDWFETNRKTKAPALQYDDWDTGDQYL